jgi:toxin ParE1/3/4
MYQLQILRQAREDMQSSANWYNEQQAGLGERFLSEVIKTLRLTEANPLHYEKRFSKKFRFARVHDFPFVVVFKIKDELVIINSVFHTSRNPKRFV